MSVRDVLAALLTWRARGLSLHVQEPSLQVQGCRDAEPGERCHSAAVWAKGAGAREHAWWFPGEPDQYNLRDFQALLHHLGAAGCEQPCSQDDAGRPLSLLGHGWRSSQESAARASERTGTFQRFDGDSGHERMSDEDLEELWQRLAPGAPGEGPAAARRGLCEDAQRGSQCFRAVHWLRRKGLKEHPDWYPGLSPASDFRDVQAALHGLGKSNCSAPCTRNGRPDQVVGNSTDEDLSTCQDAAKNDWCYRAAWWLKSDGIRKHPEWYPWLNSESPLKDFQEELNRQGKSGCRRPCPDALDAAPAAERRPQDPARRAPPTEVPSASAARPAETEEEDACYDALEGEECFLAVTYARTEDIVKHPLWYPDLTPESSFKKFQQHLYLRHRSDCKKPCSGAHAKGSVKLPITSMSDAQFQDYVAGDWDGYEEHWYKGQPPKRPPPPASPVPRGQNGSTQPASDPEQASTSAPARATEEASTLAPARAPEEASTSSAPARAPEEASTSSAPARAPEEASTSSAPARAPEEASTSSAPARAPEEASTLAPVRAPEEVSTSAPARAPEEASAAVPETDPELAIASAPEPASTGGRAETSEDATVQGPPAHIEGAATGPLAGAAELPTNAWEQMETAEEHESTAVRELREQLSQMKREKEEMARKLKDVASEVTTAIASGPPADIAWPESAGGELPGNASERPMPARAAQVGPLEGRWVTGTKDEAVVQGVHVHWKSGAVWTVRADGGDAFSVSVDGQEFKARRVNSSRLEWDDGDSWDRLPDEGALPEVGAGARQETQGAGTNASSSEKREDQLKSTFQWPKLPHEAEAAEDASLSPEARERQKVVFTGEPNEPGCFMRCPTGCANHPMKTRMWRHDVWAEENDLTKSSCDARKRWWDEYCGTEDATVRFVAGEIQGVLSSDSGTGNGSASTPKAGSDQQEEAVATDVANEPGAFPPDAGTTKPPEAAIAGEANATETSSAPAAVEATETANATAGASSSSSSATTVEATRTANATAEASSSSSSSATTVEATETANATAGAEATEVAEETVAARQAEATGTANATKMANAAETVSTNESARWWTESTNESTNEMASTAETVSSDESVGKPAVDAAGAEGAVAPANASVDAAGAEGAVALANASATEWEGAGPTAPGAAGQTAVVDEEPLPLVDEDAGAGQGGAPGAEQGGAAGAEGGGAAGDGRAGREDAVVDEEPLPEVPGPWPEPAATEAPAPAEGSSSSAESPTAGDGPTEPRASGEEGTAPAAEAAPAAAEAPAPAEGSSSSAGSPAAGDGPTEPRASGEEGTAPAAEAADTVAQRLKKQVMEQIRQEMASQATLTTTTPVAETPEMVAQRLKKQVMEQIRQDMASQATTTTSTAEPMEDMEARIKAIVMKQATEPMAREDLEARVRASVMKQLAAQKEVKAKEGKGGGEEA